MPAFQLHTLWQLIARRGIGYGRDAAPLTERGLFGGWTARCKSAKRGEWLASGERDSEVEALLALWTLCAAEGGVERGLGMYRDCPLFETQERIFGGVT
jgi:hypothetical protein